MGTIADKLNRVLESKSQIKDALISKGVEVPDNTPFRSYPSLVDNIQTGRDLNIAFGENPPEDTSKLWVESEEKDLAILNSSELSSVKLCNIDLPANYWAESTILVGHKLYLFAGAAGASNPNTSDYRVKIFDLQNGTFETLPFEIPRYCAPALVGTKIYIFGGRESGSSVSTDVIRVLDTETDSLTELTVTLVNKVEEVMTVVVGTKIYLFGGNKYFMSNKYTNTIGIFDTETQTLRYLDTTMPRSYAASVVLYENKVYFIGGLGFVSSATSTTISYTNTIRIFNLETETFETSNVTLPYKSHNTAVAVYGGKIYIFGGMKDDSSGLWVTDNILVYDIATDSINLSSTILPVGFTRSCAVLIDSVIYLFGGLKQGSTMVNTFMFDPATEKFALQNCLVMTANDDGRNVCIADLDPIAVYVRTDGIYTGSINGTCTKVPAHVYENGEWVEI